MFVLSRKKYLIISIVFHVFIFLIGMVGLDFSSPLAVIENTNQHDVISAVVLGDTAKSKVLPKEFASPSPSPFIKKEKLKPKERAMRTLEKPKKEVVPLKIEQKKAQTKEKALVQKMQHEWFGKDLLADIKKADDKQKKLKQKQLQTQFQKMLRAQTEKSLRQQLLDEQIKLRGTQNFQSQGEINKYKALIMQAISERWIIPTQTDKKRYCELMIRVAPGGMVLDVQVTKTSGDPSLDSSARIAVLKASPLPVPKDASAFEPFRQFILKVKPENVLSSEEV